MPAPLGERQCRRLLRAEFRRTQQAPCRTVLVAAVRYGRDLVARELMIPFVANGRPAHAAGTPALAGASQVVLRLRCVAGWLDHEENAAATCAVSSALRT